MFDKEFKRIIEIDINGGFIVIECEHGSLVAFNDFIENDIVAWRYMAEELKKDKALAKVIDLRIIDKKDSAE